MKSALGVKLCALVVCMVAIALGSLAAPVEARGYALVSAGAPHDKQHYGWYWGATSGMYNVLRERYGYWDEDIYFLFCDGHNNDARVDRTATKANIEWALRQIASKAKATDVVFCYFVGHGGHQGSNSTYEATDGSILDTTMASWASGIGSSSQVFCFSQCNSGHFPAALAHSGRTVMTSCTVNESNAAAWAEPIRDAFNMAAGADTNGDKRVSVAEAYNYALRRVQHYYQQHYRRQTEHSQIDDNQDGRSSYGILPTAGHGTFAGSQFLGHGCGQIQMGVIQAKAGQQVTFPHAFTRSPTIVVSAQRAERALAAAAVDNAKTGFRLALRDHAGNAVKQNAWIQWVATVPSDSGIMQSGTQWVAHSGTRIKFAQSFSGTPVIVTNAQRQGVALLSGALDNAATGFRIATKNDQDQAVNGAWVQWIALRPPLDLTGLQAKGAVRLCNDRVRLTFSPAFATNPTIIASAQRQGGHADMACGVSNAKTGCLVYITQHDGARAANSWLQWLAFSLR